MGKVEYELHPGQMVGEYRIERKIGEGGFGKVYAAVHPLIGKAVAVKVLNPELASSEEMVGRFVAEARSVNQIRHRNIIDIFAFGTLPGGLHYFVMEMLDGMSLDAYVKKNAPLDPAHALSILWPIGRALVAAHKAGILHRDLKPDNVFLTIDQDGAIFPKLLDFGIAKLLREGEMAHRTKTGAMMGTPVYMSPEQCKGSNIDHRSDIYSFGIMIHEVLTGRRPFIADSLVELLLKQVNEAAPPMSSARPGLPRALDAAVLRMLEKAPERRPESMQAALDEVLAAARSSGIEVPASIQSPALTPQPSQTAPAQLVAPAQVAATQPRPAVTPAPGQQAYAAAPAQPYPAPRGPHDASFAAGQPPPYAMQHSTPHGQAGAAWSGASQGHAITPPGVYGYPTGHHGPTLQSAGAPEHRKSSLGVILAIAGGLVLLVFLGIGILALSAVSTDGGGASDEFALPDEGTAMDFDSTAELSLSFTAPGQTTPRAGVNVRQHRRHRIILRETDEEAATRLEVQYGENVTTTQKAGESPQVENKPTANKSYSMVTIDSGVVVAALDGSPVSEQERREVEGDAGEWMSPRSSVLGRLAVGDSASLPSDAALRLLGLGTSDPGETARADNATFKLLSRDSAAHKVTFEVALLYVLEVPAAQHRIESSLKGTAALDERTGRLLQGSLAGPVGGYFNDGGTRYSLSGRMSVQVR